MTKNYVDNKLLHQEMVKYIAVYKQSLLDKKPRPGVSDYIGECIWLIANGLSTNRNFIGYSYRDEMIGDAVENCLRYLHNFDPEKSNNPFAYFTQIMYYAFLRRIEKEKKQTYIKYKAYENSVVTTDMSSSDGPTRSSDDSSHQAYFEKMAILSERYEPKINTRKREAKSILTELAGEDNEQPI